jgi:hypothetical protein
MSQPLAPHPPTRLTGGRPLHLLVSLSLLLGACVDGGSVEPEGNVGAGGAPAGAGGRGGNGTAPGGSGGNTGGGNIGGSGPGVPGTGGSTTSGTGGATTPGTGGSGTTPGTGGSVGSGTGGGGGRDAGGELPPSTGEMKGDPKFSFFYTSLAAMRRLSKSQNGFGGDLRFGQATGLEGADKICQTIAAEQGHGAKTWRAFLSALKGPDGQPVHAINRVGNGPWYDLLGRLIARDKAGLISGNRPAGDGPAVNDLPDETGAGTKRMGDTHDVITASNAQGMLATTGVNDTCLDWTSATVRGRIQMGHAWPAGSGQGWIRAHTEPTCVAGVNLVQNGPGNGSSIGAGGGWGGIYCFAVAP